MLARKVWRRGCARRGCRFVQRVPENLREEFIAAVTRRYLAKHPPDADGQVHVRMVRLEIDAVKI